MLFSTKDEKEVQRNFIDMVKRLSEEDDVSLVVGNTMIKLGPPCKFVFTDKSDKKPGTCTNLNEPGELYTQPSS